MFKGLLSEAMKKYQYEKDVFKQYFPDTQHNTNCNCRKVIENIGKIK